MKGLLLLLVLLILPTAFAAQPQPPPVNSTTTTTTTSSLPGGIQATAAPQKSTYRPTFTGHNPVQDRGLISYQTTTTGFIWNKTAGQTLQMGIPSLVMATAVASLAVPQLYYNSTITQYRFFGFASTSSVSGYSITVSFKPTAYSAKVSIDGSVFALTTLRLPFNSTGAPIIQSSFINPTNGQTVLLPRIQAGNEVFDWSDIPSSFSPSWNNVSNTLAITLIPGVFHIDPLALDGSAQCAFNIGSGTSTSCSLTTTNTNDVIILEAQVSKATDTALSSVSDAAFSLTWTQRVNCVCAMSPKGFVAEWYTVATQALSADSITIHWTTSEATQGVINVFGISGANTGNCGSGGTTCYDSNGALPSTCSRFCGPGGLTVSTSNANDFIFATVNTPFEASDSARAGWTMIKNANSWLTQYEIVSATQSGANATPAGNCANDGTHSCQGGIGDAIKQGISNVNQSIKITTANSAPSATITISGCSPTNSTFTANGNVKHYVLAVSCTVTLSNPAPATYTRYVWNISPKPLPATSITFSTCAGPGTCTEYDNTTFYQLKNNYTENSLNIVWDGEYIGHGGVSPGSTNDMSGVFLGTTITVPNPNSGALKDMCALGGATINAFFSTFEAAHFGNCHDGLSLIWADYNQAQCLPTTIGNTWTVQGTHCWNDTTGNNNHQANYAQSTGGGGDAPPNYLWLLAIPLVVLVVMVARKLG